MSMENELKRIADALEKMAEAKTGGEVTYQDAEPVVKPKTKVKAKEKTAEPVAESMTPASLMAYCNGKLTKIVDKTQRGEIVQKVVAMFKEEFGVSSVKEVPQERVDDALAAFDAILGEE